MATVTGPSNTAAAQVIGQTPIEPGVTLQKPDLPPTQSDFSSTSVAAAMGLSRPNNPQDIEMLFAQVATETTNKQTETTNAAESGKMSAQTTLMNELEEAARTSSGNVFLNMFSFLMSFFFGIKVDVSVGDSNAQVSKSSQADTTDNAVKTVADFSDQRTERTLSLEGLNMEMSPEEGNPRNVADRANGFAYAVAVSDFAVMQTLASNAPLNGGADGPQQAIDGRLRLAV